ncbi:MAG TPA: NAD(P)H-quinone oxidoreductase [Steroidobacteraceae bacterium]|jgi:putative PIG3 family NAD(P)H quinone oxidoreductase|nr:NAD(P)H-quinone oxidoreductase [Steroidobacteraceae bacterium]
MKLIDAATRIDPMSNVPAEMTAIEIAAPGGPEQLKPARRPTPKPGEGEVLVRVAAAGVNRPDVMQREGRYPPPAGASDIPGLEIAGEVVALGSGASGVAVGDKVTALLPGGGYAEYAVAAAPLCLPVPKNLSMVEAAALPETFFTVWTNLFDRGGLKPGESVLIHGGTSGIGTTAIQLAAAWGAKVYATAGSADKARACERFGALRGIDYHSEDFVAAVREATGDKGVDVILDIVGAKYLARNFEAAAVEGRIVVISLMSGAKTDINLNTILSKRLTLTGSTLRIRSVAQKALVAAAVHRNVWPLIAEGRVKPIIHATFPLRLASEAHRLMESSQHIGKIVLEV